MSNRWCLKHVWAALRCAGVVLPSLAAVLKRRYLQQDEGEEWEWEADLGPVGVVLA